MLSQAGFEPTTFQNSAAKVARLQVHATMPIQLWYPDILLEEKINRLISMIAKLTLGGLRLQ